MNTLYFIELLLINMMRYVALQCPDDEYDFMVRRLRLNQEEVSLVKNDETANKQEKLQKLFVQWRRK